MGVKGLFNIIKTFASDSVVTKHMSEYRGTIQAIDASLILYKYCMTKSIVQNEIATHPFKFTRNPSGNPNQDSNCHLDTCLHKTCTMLKYGIMPIWIFDGKFPEIKLQTVNKRNKVREKAQEKLNDPKIENKAKYIKAALKLSKVNIDDVKYLLDLIGIRYIESNEEADSQCAALNIANVTNGVISEDWDMLLFGCDKLLKNFFNKTNVVEIDVKILLKKLNMNLEQLIDLSAILGNDYCQGIKGLNPIELYKKFKEHNFDMYEFLEKLEKCVIPNDFVARWKESKKYYMNLSNIKIENAEILWSQPNYSELYEYLVNEKEFPKNVINDKIDELRKMYTYYINNNCKLGPYNVVRRLQN